MGLLQSIIPNLGPTYDIEDEELEELRMVSALEKKEICRLKRVFLDVSDGQERMTMDMFLKIECIRINPLKDRICSCFGFSNDSFDIDFKTFLCGVAAFNSPGKLEEKLQIAFRIQDFDDDGVISKGDMHQYIQRIAGASEPSDVELLIENVFLECSSDPKRERITLADFQRVVVATDFHAKLHIPL